MGEILLAVLCRPVVAVPEHVITMEETLALANLLHADHPELPVALRLIRNTGVRKRHLVQPIQETLRHPGFEARNQVFVREAKARVPDVVAKALVHAGLAAEQIDAIVFVSCTGFMMPSMTAWMINSLGFRHDTRQIPIAQLGCAAGGAAINRAHDFCRAHPGANVLVVACEFCSLCYQPTDLTVGNLLANGLFGDAVAAAVVRGAGGTGFSLQRNGSRLVPDTEDWIAYAVRATGFHFLLDRRVPATMERLAPALRDLSRAHDWDVSTLDFYVMHAGGPRILDDLSRHLGVASDRFEVSRATLAEYGNIASVVVFDALRRLFDTGAVTDGARGIIAAFGPGITAEISLGVWITGRSPADPGGPRPRHQTTAGEQARNMEVPVQLTIGGDMTVNRLGYGAMHLTGPGVWGPPTDPQTAVRVLRRAVDLGVNFIDTADAYGPGDNERIIREALWPYPRDLVIATKGGLLRSGPSDWDHDTGRPPYIVPCGRPEYLRQQVELSLRNLGRDRIDLYLLHRIDPAVPLSDQLGELVRLQREGKIRHVGLSGQPAVTLDQLVAATGIADIVAVENLFNIADRTGEDVLRYCELNGIAFIPWFPLGHGELVGPDSVLATPAKELGVTPAQLGIAWLLQHSPATVLIPGTTSVAHLEENLAAAEVQLHRDRWKAIEDLCADVKPWRPPACP